MLRFAPSLFPDIHRLMWDVLLNVHEVPQAERERILSFENLGVRPRASGNNEALRDGVVLKFSSFAIDAKLQLGLYQFLKIGPNESAPKEESRSLVPA
jgi:hypothetical protein